MLSNVLGIADYGAFVLAVWLFLMVPGPGNLAIIASTGHGGMRGGLAATLGIVLADQVLLWLAVAGVAALLAAHPGVFQAVQWLGAIYLAWLGIRMLLALPGGSKVLDIQPRQFAAQAFWITLLNPKAIVFYMAFFPLFVQPATHRGLTTFAAMAVTIAALTLLYGAIAAWLTRALAGRMRRHPRWGQGLEKLAGVALVAFGIKLALGR